MVTCWAYFLSKFCFKAEMLLIQEEELTSEGVLQRELYFLLKNRRC